MVLNQHAVRNALLPTISLIALSFGFVLGGAITVEVVFCYQGSGGLRTRRSRARTSRCCRGSSCSRAPPSS